MKTSVALVLKPIWTYRDIMAYFNIKSKTTASKIKNKAIKEHGGGIKFSTKYVKSEAVLALYGTSREREIEIYTRYENLQEDCL